MVLVEMAESGNGYVTASQATEAGIPRRKLTEAVRKGNLIQVARGLYALPETWEDPYLVAQHRFADRAPFSLTMTFPRGYNATPARKAGVICRTCADDVLGLGIMELTTQHGNVVRVYDPERTLCDLVRGQRTVDSQVVIPAMQSYAKSPKQDVQKLIGYARSLGVERKIRNYLEVLL